MPPTATQTQATPTPPNYGAPQPPPAPVQQIAPAPVATSGKTNLSYGQFFGRALTASLVAPLGFFIAGLLFFGLIAGCTAVFASGADDAAAGPVGSTASIDGVEGADDVVLVVDVSGTILAEGIGGGLFGNVAGGDTIRDQLEAAAEDDDIDAVVLRLNTPGGSVVGSERITDGIAAVQAAGKPVVAHVTEISASGGMWAMAPACLLYTSPSPRDRG